MQEIKMPKWSPVFHPIIFITCSYTVQHCTSMYARLEENLTLKYKVQLIDAMHFSQTSCHRHKRIREVRSEKNLEMKDLSTNHSCIYLDNSTQEQYLRSNTYDNKINRRNITRGTLACVFSHLSYLLTYIYSHSFLYNFCNWHQRSTIIIHTRQYSQRNEKIINYALQ